MHSKIEEVLRQSLIENSQTESEVQADHSLPQQRAEQSSTTVSPTASSAATLMLNTFFATPMG